MVQQLSVFVNNEVGAALGVSRALAKGKFDVRAFSIFDTPEFCILRLVFDEGQSAEDFLNSEGFFVKSSPVLGVILEDQAGYLNSVLERIKELGLQVNYLYSLYFRGEAKPVMIIHSDNDEYLEKELKASGFELV